MGLMTFTKVFIFAYGVVFINFAFAVLLIRNKRFVHYASAAGLIDFGLMCMAGGICLHYNYEGYFVNLAVFLPMTLLSPIGAQFTLECFGARNRARPLVAILHLITVILLVLGILLPAFSVPWRVIFSVAYAWLCATYAAVVALESADFGPIRSLPEGLMLLFLLTSADVVLTGAMVVCQAFDFRTGLYGLWIILIFTILAVCLVSFRYPGTYRLIEGLATKRRQGRSRLTGIDCLKLQRQLRELMESESPYVDPKLSLTTLARLLKLSAPTLSEFLNTHLKKGFSDYVNGFRVELAKQLLREKPAATILEIAFTCGFSSKSTFNAAFRKATGQTPHEYRTHPSP